MRLAAIAFLAVAAGGAVYAVAPGPPARQTSAAEITRETPGGQRRFLTAAERGELSARGLAPLSAKSVLDIKRPLRHGDYVWDERGVPEGEVEIRVDLTGQLVSVYRAGHEIATAVITFGARGHDTPTGTLQVIGKFREHRSSIYGADMPYTLRLTDDGISIHASDVRWGTATHGCIGVPDGFARRLFDAVELGQPVLIRSPKPSVSGFRVTNI